MLGKLPIKWILRFIVQMQAHQSVSFWIVCKAPVCFQASVWWLKLILAWLDATTDGAGLQWGLGIQLKHNNEKTRHNTITNNNKSCTRSSSTSPTFPAPEEDFGGDQPLETGPHEPRGSHQSRGASQGGVRHLTTQVHPAAAADDVLHQRLLPVGHWDGRQQPGQLSECEWGDYDCREQTVSTEEAWARVPHREGEVAVNERPASRWEELNHCFYFISPHFCLVAGFHKDSKDMHGNKQAKCHIALGAGIVHFHLLATLG